MSVVLTSPTYHAVVDATSWLMACLLIGNATTVFGPTPNNALVASW